MTKIFYSFLILIFTVFNSVSQTEIVVPDFHDVYSDTLRKLESGQTDIDYPAFRESFIQSRQFIIASGKSGEMDKLTKEMYAKMHKSDYSAIIKITKKMLSIDYTNMMAHKILRQTYKIIGDSINAQKYKAIQFGLMNSIIKNGDSKTCETGWPVIQVEEEYFILQMLDAELVSQSLITSNGVCDKMEVKINNETRIIYFETSKVFEGYKKLGL